MKAERTGAWLLLASVTIATFGMAWDIQWHTDVGPDTFFTAPHLVMYLGTAATGFTSLAVVLHRTFRRNDPAVRTVTVLGTFQAPIPFLVAGLGAAAELLYGLTDLWWHTVYGFDATPTSPPHVAMSLCVLVETVGAVMAFASLRGTRSGRAGLAVYAGVAAYAQVFLLLSTPKLPLVNEFFFAVALMCVLGMVLVAAVTRSPGLVVVTGLSFAAVHAVTWVTVPPLTRAYAGWIDLPIRDFVTGSPAYASFSPLAMLPVAVVVAGVLALGKRFGSVKGAVMLTGAVGAALLTLGYSVQFGLMDGTTVAITAVSGAVMGLAAWRMGAPLRNLSEV
ncbi:hypothetical protein [Kibdelosporangium phytohabitans]|uniref:Uncharacterized protein n=1 Tax=Kibdelosporangium phytohabitans TaxID=860235 RepID=A0A0N9I7X8_9PSEU|nr:hypothetical protein [Kibdelosporangium phytohabitans]ALG11025.1 hypothetical protein AOZ06_32765 [Kibdelosporangium phytohabitans]MBE1462251.1 hypothetical protein [Kibdelosporangium phytohabitans]